MALASGNFQALLEPRLRKVFFESYDERAPEYTQVYNLNGSKKAKETDQHVAGLGAWPKKEPQGNIEYENINMGDEVSYVHEEYAKGISIERKLADDELYGVIDKLPKSLGKGGRVIVEQVSADILNDGFTVNGYDGTPLFSDSHKLNGTKGGVCDNLFDDVLSDTGIKNGRLLIKRLVDDAGIKIQAMADTIIVPDDLEMTLLTLLQTDKLVGNNFNDKSQIFGKYKAVVMTYLDDPASWFMQDSSMNEMNFFWRVKPEFAAEENFDTMIAKYRGYLRFSVGYSDFRGIAGSNPA
jgi:phage major head subunit gpT-like protein